MKTYWVSYSFSDNTGHEFGDLWVDTTNEITLLQLDDIKKSIKDEKKAEIVVILNVFEVKKK